jgi:hypothetical protein
MAGLVSKTRQRIGLAAVVGDTVILAKKMTAVCQLKLIVELVISLSGIYRIGYFLLSEVYIDIGRCLRTVVMATISGQT